MTEDILHDLQRYLKETARETGNIRPNTLPQCLADTLERAVQEIEKLRQEISLVKNGFAYGPDILRVQGLQESLQGLQESLERSLKREEKLKERIDELKTDLIHMKDMRDKILEERPLELLPGWALPEVLCKCGNKVHPEAVHDTGGWELCWPEECDECNLTVIAGEDIQWPFKVERAWAKDFERLGFDVE